MLEDLIEIDSIILDLDDSDYTTSVTTYEKLKREYSHNWEAFTYAQERARNKMREIISLVRMRTCVKQVLHIF
jgi:hypothetical protein